MGVETPGRLQNKSLGCIAVANDQLTVQTPTATDR